MIQELKLEIAKLRRDKYGTRQNDAARLDRSTGTAA